MAKSFARAVAVLLLVAMATPPLAAAGYRTHTGTVAVSTTNTTVTFTDNGSGGDGLEVPAKLVAVYNNGPATIYVDCKDGTATTADTAVPPGVTALIEHNASVGPGTGYTTCGLITAAGSATAYVSASQPRTIDLVPGGAPDLFRPGDAELEVSSANAAAANNQTLAAAAGKRTYITGFSVTGGGATVASVIAITVTGLTNTLTFHLPIPAGATAGVSPLVVDFARPIPASADNAAIVVNVPSFGAGNTAASATARGFQR